MVSDNRRLEGVVDPDQLWLRDTWVPLAVASGLKRIGVVVPHHGLGKIATEQILGVRHALLHHGVRSDRVGGGQAGMAAET